MVRVDSTRSVEVTIQHTNFYLVLPETTSNQGMCKNLSRTSAIIDVSRFRDNRM